MYADDTIIYVTAETSHLAAEMLTRQLVSVSQWLQDNCLTLNYNKTVSMCFSLKNKVLDGFKIKIDQNEIKEVNEFKYLGVIVDSKLKFDSHIKKMSKTIKTNLSCFRLIRPCISIKAAQMYMHTMILSHMTYCAIIWGQASQSVIKPVMSLYKQTLKVMDQKPMKWHHCQIVQKYDLLSFDNFLKFSFLKTVFKCLYGLAPDVICQLIEKYSSDGVKTRGLVSGNCRVRRCRTAMGQSSFSVKGGHLWNTMPGKLKLQPELTVFCTKLKQWLKSIQRCEH
jgi:hypothetical protein